MDKELYLLGVDEGNGTCVKPSVSLFRIGENGVLQLLDIYNIEIGENINAEIEKASSTYEELYRPELARLKSELNKWYSKVEGSKKIKVNNTLLDQLKKFQFR